MPNLFECILELPDFGILFSWLPNCFGDFNQLLSKDPPKLLENYDTFNLYFSYSTSLLLIALSLVPLSIFYLLARSQSTS